MISRLLTYYAQLMNEFMDGIYLQPEGVSEVGFIGSRAEGRPNKLVVGLLSVEREAAAGITPMRSQTASGDYSQSLPALYINLNVIISAVYDSKRYVESLSVLSSALMFIQANTVFVFEQMSYTIEVISLSSQEFHNIWSSMGGQSYPSVVCKIRRLTFDARDVSQTIGAISKPIIRF